MDEERTYGKLDSYIDSIEEKEEALIHILHRAQEIFGYLPYDIQRHIALRLGIPLAKVYGVVSFYSYFSMVPRGTYPISVCMGTACFVKGAQKVMDEFSRCLDIGVGETSSNGRFSLHGIRCIGACGVAPVVLIGDKVYPNVKPEEVKKILAEYGRREV